MNGSVPLLDSYVCTIQNEHHREENASGRRGPRSGLFGDCPHCSGGWHGRMAPGPRHDARHREGRNDSRVPQTMIKECVVAQ